MGDQDFLQHQTGTAQPQARQALLLGRYRVMKPGEAGGFGTVLTCWDTRLQRRVAIKRIPLMGQGGGAAASTISEALAEARTASMLAHPNIVTMYDFEVDRAYAYGIRRRPHARGLPRARGRRHAHERRVRLPGAIRGCGPILRSREPRAAPGHQAHEHHDRALGRHKALRLWHGDAGLSRSRATWWTSARTSSRSRSWCGRP